MEAVIFCGIQATGKSTFFKNHFFRTHVRISMDQLQTRNKENKFLEVCLQTQHPFVVDNTNVSRQEREKYIVLAKAHKYTITCYYFSSKLEDAMLRNQVREGKERIPDVGIRGTYARMELPDPAEGFDRLFYVSLEGNRFIIKEWDHEI